MSQAYVIEVRSQTAGIVVRDGRRFYFFAAAHRFNALEGQAFNSPEDAQKAAQLHLAGTRTTSARWPDARSAQAPVHPFLTG